MLSVRQTAMAVRVNDIVQASDAGELLLRISDVTDTGQKTPRSRRSARSRVRVAASVEIDGALRPANLLNMSATGALLELDAPPAAGTDILLLRGALRSRGRVVRVEGSRCAIRFDKPVPALEIAAATHPRGRIVRAVS